MNVELHTYSCQEDQEPFGNLKIFSFSVTTITTNIATTNNKCRTINYIEVSIVSIREAEWN